MEYGRTEVIDNTLNPDFVHKFMMDYFFEERQNLRFDLAPRSFHTLARRRCIHQPPHPESLSFLPGELNMPSEAEEPQC
ncbi:unnamed protein product [Boreogadus saida]